MQQPKVSIIVPCWKVENYIDRCIESLTNQKLHDIEIILVDDASPDRVPEICDIWATRDRRIKVVHKQKNEGLGMACNTGIENASGKYIAFCDSDDWVETNMYKTMYDFAEMFQVQMVFTGLKRINELDVVVPMPHPSKQHVYNGRKEVDELMLDIIASEPSDSMERHIAMSAKVVLYSKALIDLYNIRFESERTIISEDLFFNLDNLIHAENVAVLPNRFYYYFWNSQSLTTKVITDRFEKNLTMREALLKRYTSHEMPEAFKTRVNRLFIGYTRNDMRNYLRNSDLDKNELNKIIERICGDSIWDELIHCYPVNKMPIKHRLYFYATVHSNKILLNFLSHPKDLVHSLLRLC